jgi:hypothetical protein
MADKIRLQQALFGYRDGHNLLATSTPLTSRVRQFLATITDSSGPENNKSFEGAFTGLPVPETDFYALFRTWTAQEMPRPGCVWSHVILVELADLARIPELLLLGQYCSRPSVPIDLACYEEPLALDVTNTKDIIIYKPDHKRLSYLVRTLYDYPDASVVILDEASSFWENEVFKVWTQQWPRLRREFVFSTGSLGDRRLAGISFDLQIAPISSERLWRRTEDLTLLVRYSPMLDELIGETDDELVSIVEKDLSNASNRSFRQFLFDYGSDVEKPRAGFGKLAAVYKHVRTLSDASWQDILNLVGEFFPSPNEAVRLKKWLITLPVTLNSSAKLERVWSIVSFLLDSQQSVTYPIADFDFANFAHFLWREKRGQTLALLSRLVQQDEKPAALSFAEAIANVVDSCSLRAIAEGNAELVTLVIRHNPALAFEVDTWKLNGHIQTQVFETLKKLSLSPADWGQVVGAMFIAATYVSVREAVTMAAPFAMVGAFRWLDNEVAKSVLPSHSWRDALASAAVEELKRNRYLQPAKLALSAWCIPADELRWVLSASREDIQRLSESSLEDIPYPLRLPTAFLLLTLGLRSEEECGVNLVLKNFFTVHAALASSSHSSESWWLLSPELPSLGWWKDWDHCKRLRRAVRNILGQHHVYGGLMAFATTAEERRIAEKFRE